MDDILFSRQISFPSIPKEMSSSQTEYLKKLQIILDEHNRKSFDAFLSITGTTTSVAVIVGVTPVTTKIFNFEGGLLISVTS